MAYVSTVHLNVLNVFLRYYATFLLTVTKLFYTLRNLFRYVKIKILSLIAHKHLH